MLAVFALDALIIIFRADPHARALAVGAGNSDVTESGLPDALIREMLNSVGVSLGRLGRELAPERLRLGLQYLRWPRGPLDLRVARRIPVGCRETGAKNAAAVFALDAPIDVFGGDAHVVALAARAGNTDVTSHGLLESPIKEPVNRVGIRPSRFIRRRFIAWQEALSFCASVLDHGRR
jgi:hypothetical protein